MPYSARLMLPLMAAHGLLTILQAPMDQIVQRFNPQPLERLTVSSLPASFQQMMRSK